MAIFHLSAQVISRSGGRSCIAAAAYRAAEKILDKRLGLTMDYSLKGGVEYSEIITPDGSPEWVHDRAELWNAVEASEKRKDAQLAREIQVGLPKELSKEAQVELVRNYVRDSFVKEGMVADFSIHRDNPENPHAHIMLTMREVSESGFGQKNREWNSTNYLLAWRENWAMSVNLELSREGYEQQVDHRSYSVQGIQIEPTSKVGASLENARNDGRDIVRERAQEHLEIARRNGERILKDPEIALEAITHQQATFTQADVGRWLNTRTFDAEQFQGCLARVMGSEELVSVGVDDKCRERFTTREMVQVEKNLQRSTRELLGREGHGVSERFLDQAEAQRTLTGEQKNAFRHITENTPDIAVVEGYAGTGKSYMLGAAREGWEAQGYRVLGAALAGKAAESLEVSSGIQSRSLHAWEYAWKKGTEQLTSKDVLVVDEAGMVGARQMNRVLERVKNAGAKLVLVGDTEQIQAIEAGAPMRLIAREVGSETLSEIRRQKETWQKQATVDLHNGRTDRALEAYWSRGLVHEHETQKEALDSMVDAWDQHRQAHPRESQLMLAYKRVDVFELNMRAREIRRSGGELKGRDYKVETKRGERDFAAGDRVCFLKNNRTLGVKNGTLGTIEIMEKGQAVIRLDGPGRRRIALDFKRYNHLDHGYAATVHKSQGATVDRVHVLASRLFDRHTAYVGMTRHTGQADLHWSREEFSGQKDLYDTLSCERKKDMVVDYEKAGNDNSKLAVDIEKGRGFERSASAVEREARNIEKDWNAKKPASLKELAEELDGMSNKVDPSLSAIEKEFGTIENVDELDRVLEKAKGRYLDKDRGLTRHQDQELNEHPKKEYGKDHQKDKGIGRDLSHERGERGGFEFDL